MAALIAASGLMASFSSAKKSEIEFERQRAQKRAKRRQLADQQRLDIGNFHNNEVLIQQQRMRNDFDIQGNKLDAQDAFTQAFIGSGISGRTVDAMESTLNSEVAKAHIRNSQQAKEQSDNQFLGLMRRSKRYEDQIRNEIPFDIDAMVSNNAMAGASAMIQTASSFAGQMGGSPDTLDTQTMGKSSGNFNTGGSSKLFDIGANTNISNNIV